MPAVLVAIFVLLVAMPAVLVAILVALFATPVVLVAAAWRLDSIDAATSEKPTSPLNTDTLPLKLWLSPKYDIKLLASLPLSFVSYKLIEAPQGEQLAFASIPALMLALASV